MTLITSKQRIATAVNVDALLHDSYLLVVELRQGASVRDNKVLKKLCVEQVERVRQHLEDADLDQRSIDHISHAQCALLDETVLTFAEADVRAHWAGEPLQAMFFNRHQAGEFLYEDMRTVLREPSPNRQVLTAFQRVLVFGFLGRCKAVADPQRAQILEALNALVAPLEVRGLETRPAEGELIDGSPSIRSPRTHALAVVLVLAGVWWSMDHLLKGVIASLLPGQA